MKHRFLRLFLSFSPTHVHGDFAEMFEDGFEVIGDLPHEHVGPGKVAGTFAPILGSRSIGGRLRAGEVNITSPDSLSSLLGIRWRVSCFLDARRA